MGGVGRQSRREEREEPSLRGESEGLTWLRVGFCDCCFCLPWLWGGAGGWAVGGGRKEKHPFSSWRSSGQGSLGARSCLCLTSPLPDRGWRYTFLPEDSLGLSPGPGASALTVFFLGSLGAPGGGRRGAHGRPPRQPLPAPLLQHGQQRPLLHREGGQRAHHKVPPSPRPHLRVSEMGCSPFPRPVPAHTSGRVCVCVCVCVCEICVARAWSI